MRFVLFTLLLLPLLAMSQNASFVSENGVLKVKGNQIVNQKGEAFSYAGQSLFWGTNKWEGEKYYQESQVKFFREEWKTVFIRPALAVEIKGGYIEDPNENMAKMKRVIDAAIKHDLYVLVDFHSHHAEDYQKEAIIFFTQIAREYGSYANIIYEIYNEPLDVSWNEIIRPYALGVIEAIRKYDSDNMILVGTPNWSQDVDDVIANPITEFENIAYTLHFYAASHKEELRMKAKKTLDAGIPIFVSEWGTIKANGDGEVDEESVMEWMAFMKTYNLSHLNWSICDKNEGASVFKANIGVKPFYNDEDFSPSGIQVRSIILDWNQTVKE